MISAKIEEQVRNLIKEGLSDYDISYKINIYYRTVVTIRKMIQTIKHTTVMEREKIIALLIGGFPTGAISTGLNVSKEKINAVRRYYYLRTYKANKKRSVPLCDKCKDSININKDARYAIELCTPVSIVEDLVCLDRLNLINSPLFCSLATKARTVLERYQNGEKKNT